MDQAKPADRNAALDGVRGFAALSVVLFHLWLYARPDPPAGAAHAALDRIWSSGRLGYELFFVLSGFLLFRPWLAASRDRASRPRLGSYLLRRGARIMPAYYAALVGAVALLWGLGAVPGVRLPDPRDLPLFLFFGQNFEGDAVMKLDPPMWTLSVEVCFYAVLPLIGALTLRLGRQRIGWALLALGLAGLGWDTLARALEWSLVATKVLPAMLPFFAAGMAIALAPRPRTRLASRLLLVLGALLIASNTVLGALAQPALSLSRDLPATLGFAAIVLACAGDHAPRLLTARPIAFLGTLSYGLYLWHVPVLWWLRGSGLLPLAPVAALPVVLIPSLALAYASWRVLEAPAIRWARMRTARALGGEGLARSASAAA